MNAPRIVAQNAGKTYSGRAVLRNIDLEIAPGEIVGIFGGNGSGKSTLLRILAGALRPSSGTVSIRGNFGYVPQSFSLYEDLSVQENLAFFARCYGLSGRELQEHVAAALSRLDLLCLRRETTGNLSHGMKQRVALASALCHEPSSLLLDEPSAGLDPVSRERLWTTLRECAATGVSVVISTHYLEEAQWCGRLAYLSEGRLLWVANAAVLIDAGYGAAAPDHARSPEAECCAK